LKRVKNQQLPYYRFDHWQNLTHGVFTRNGGVSESPWATLNLGGNVGDKPEAVRHNHELLYDTLGLDPARACTVWQVHGTDVIIANQPVQGRRWLAHADAMVTDQPDTPLVMRYADCTPLLFHAPVRGVIAIAHAGWRGTVKGMGAQVVATMQQAYGCKPAAIQAAIGPSIGPERYQVGEEVVAAVLDYFGTLDGLVTRDPSDSTAYLNLWAANRLDLERAGVEQIEVAGICTAENTAEFFSHRAEKGQTGRFGVVISL